MFQVCFSTPLLLRREEGLFNSVTDGGEEGDRLSFSKRSAETRYILRNIFVSLISRRIKDEADDRR